ncbi:MAG: TetR/AcrR family transcriptional regulator [Sphingomonadaceae bacterium]|nr:TetR/AcrR family transcriptional regulator [Sphingomonadaceae bacterium]
MVGKRGASVTGVTRVARQMGSKSMDAAASLPREPRTERGRRTQRAILDAAAAEFGEKGFHDSSIVSITQRAGVALGSFYTYFESKEALFKALVLDMSEQVRQLALPIVAEALDPVETELSVLTRFLEFARDHSEIYRIIDEAEFVAPDAWRAHYYGGAGRIYARIKAAKERGEIAGEVDEIHAWAIIGMNVFLGLRYGVLERDRSPAEVAAIANQLLQRGLR